MPIGLTLLEREEVTARKAGSTPSRARNEEKHLR
jgi:hypothetical protein